MIIRLLMKKIKYSKLQKKQMGIKRPNYYHLMNFVRVSFRKYFDKTKQ